MSKVASMVDNPCRTTHTVISSNRWNAADPLVEKYHGISPYAYCAITAVVGFIRLLTSDFCVVRVCHS